MNDYVKKDFDQVVSGLKVVPSEREIKLIRGLLKKGVSPKTIIKWIEKIKELLAKDSSLSFDKIENQIKALLAARENQSDEVVVTAALDAIEQEVNSRIAPYYSAPNNG